MKRIVTTALILGMMLSAAACGSADVESTTTEAPSTTETTTEASVAPVTPSVNEGEFKAGVYTATSSYASGEMNMTWNFVLTLKADGTFQVTDGTTEKGTGTYALAGDHYELTYSDDRTSSFVVQKDGTLKMTADFPYGIATIQLALVGDIIFSFDSEVPSEGGNEEGGESGTETGDVYTIAAGTYNAVYEKVSPMAGTVLYKYTATIGEDGTFSYGVTFAMGETEMAGSSASGTYTVDGNKFVFTDSEGNVTEGTLTAENALTISLKASAMASTPYEVTFAPAAYTIAAGTYNAVYEKVSPMAGTVLYNYTATIGEDGTFSYGVTFAMGETEMAGSSASGTYTVDGNKFVFTDSEGNVTEGTLTAENTLVISLKASTMAKDPYEVTFTVAE